MTTSTVEVQDRGWVPKDRERVAVVIHDRFWAGTITYVTVEGTIRVLADCGVHTWYAPDKVWSLERAIIFLTGRIVGWDAAVISLRAGGHEQQANRLARNSVKAVMDLSALRRG